MNREPKLFARAVLLALSFVACVRLPAPESRGTTTVQSPPHVTAGELQTAQLVSDLTKRALEQGASAPTDVFRGPLGEGERRGAFVEFAQDACLLVYGRASGAIEDLDVVIFSDEGVPLVIDESPDAKPTLLLCPPHPARIFVSVTSASGEGSVAVRAHVVSKAKADLIAQSLGARGTSHAPRPADAWPGLAEAVREHRTRVGGLWQDTRKVALPVDPRSPTVMSLVVDASACADIFVQPSDEVAMVDAELVDEGGRVVARAHDGPNARSLVLCSDRQRALSLSLRPHFGRGLVAVVLGRSISDSRDVTPSADFVWTERSRAVEAAKADLLKKLHDMGYIRPVTNSVGKVALGRRTHVTLATNPRFDGCVRIDVAGAATLGALVVRGYNRLNESIAEAEGPLDATLYSCTGELPRVDVESIGASGAFVVVVHHAIMSHPLLLKHPTAGARLLREIDALRAHPLQLKLIEVPASKRVDDSVLLRPQECVEVAVGVEGSGGIEGRLATDAGDELDRAWGASGVHLRGCASANSEKVTLELLAARDVRVLVATVTKGGSPP